MGLLTLIWSNTWVELEIFVAVEHYMVIRDRTLEIATQKHFTSGTS